MNSAQGDKAEWFFFYSLSYVSILLHHNIINQSNCAWSSYVTMAMPACTVKNKTSVLLLKFRESKNLTAWRSSPWENRYLGKGKPATFVLEGEDEGSPLTLSLSPGIVSMTKRACLSAEAQWWFSSQTHRGAFSVLSSWQTSFGSLANPWGRWRKKINAESRFGALTAL